MLQKLKERKGEELIPYKKVIVPQHVITPGEEKIDGEENNINHLEISPYSRINLNYYISPQFRLNVYYSVNYRHLESDSEYYWNMYNDYMKYKHFNQRLSIGFIYQIL